MKNESKKHCPVIDAPCTKPDCKHWVSGEEGEGHCSQRTIGEGVVGSLILGTSTK